MRLILGGACLLILVLYLAFGTVEPCGIVREQVRQAARREGGLGEAVASLPNGLLDALIEGRYGTMSPGRCISVALLGGPDKAAQAVQNQPETPANDMQIPMDRPKSTFTPTSMSKMPLLGAAREAFHKAILETTQAMTDCRNKRLSGELTSHFASARCSNPRIIAAFARADFYNMDLVYKFASDRSLVAQRIDNGDLTEQDGDKILQGILSFIVLQDQEAQ